MTEEIKERSILDLMDELFRGASLLTKIRINIWSIIYKIKYFVTGEF